MLFCGFLKFSETILPLFISGEFISRNYNTKEEKHVQEIPGNTIMDEPDIKLAGYPALVLGLIPDIRDKKPGYLTYTRLNT